MEAYDLDYSPIVARTMLHELGYGLSNSDGMFNILSNRMFWTMYESMRRAAAAGLNRPNGVINVQPKLRNRSNHVSVEIYPSEPNNKLSDDPTHISVDIFPREVPTAAPRLSRKGDQPVPEPRKGDQREQRDQATAPRKPRDPDETAADEARRATADCLLQLIQFFTRKINMLVKSQVDRLLKHVM